MAEVDESRFRCNGSLDFFRSFELGPAVIGVPKGVLDNLHLSVIIFGLSACEVVGITLNILIFIVFCKDKKNRGSVQLLLQVVTFFDILYLLGNAAGTTVPVIWQYLKSTPRSCSLTPYMKIRLDYFSYFQVGLNGLRDVIRWLMIVVAEYTLVPYCCAGQAVKKMYNRIFAMIEVFLMIGFVAAINTFDFICGGRGRDQRSRCQSNLIAPHFFVERFNIFIPYCMVLCMYCTLALLMYVKRGTSTDPRPWPFMLQVKRAFATLTLFIVCEAASTLHWLFYWEMVPLTVEEYRWIHYITGYCMYFFTHIYCAFKFPFYLCIGTDFRLILSNMCCCSKRSDLGEQDMRPVLDYDDNPKHAQVDWPDESNDIAGEDHPLHANIHNDSQNLELLTDDLRKDGTFGRGNQMTKV